MRGRLLEVLHRKGKNSRHKSGTSTLRGSTTNQRSRVRARSDSWRGVGIDAGWRASRAEWRGTCGASAPIRAVAFGSLASCVLDLQRHREECSHC